MVVVRRRKAEQASQFAGIGDRIGPEIDFPDRHAGSVDGKPLPAFAVSEGRCGALGLGDVLNTADITDRSHRAVDRFENGLAFGAYPAQFSGVGPQDPCIRRPCLHECQGQPPLGLGRRMGNHRGG